LIAIYGNYVIYATLDIAFVTLCILTVLCYAVNHIFGMGGMMAESDQRRQIIEKILKQDGAWNISDLAAKLGVSTMTIRRDLDFLAKKGNVRVYHGVAVASSIQNYQITEAESARTEEKRRIAAAAAALVGPGETIIIDAGSTAAMTARELPRGMPLTVICLSLNAFLIVLGNPDVQPMMIGGVYHESSRVFESPEGIALLNRHRAAKAFISTSGCREDMGVTCSNQFEIGIKKASLKCSIQKILITDSSKFGKVNTCFFADLVDFDTIITDTGVSEEIVNSLQNQGIQVITV
jgi:DeoR family deoxyribose operon repressor